jgi:predicted tellurium resistance membrane protein TerC
VVLGLLISIPIVIFGSTLVLKLVERFPIIIQLGAAVLAYTAAHMVTNEALLDAYLDGDDMVHKAIRAAIYVSAIAGVLGLGWLATRKRAKDRLEQAEMEAETAR